MRPPYNPTIPQPTGAEFKALRVSMGLSRPALAVLLEISVASIEAYEYQVTKCPRVVWKLFNLLAEDKKC